MNVIERLYGRIEKGSLSFDENEVALRLKTQRGYTNELIEKCKSTLLESTDCRYCAVRMPIYVDGYTVDFGGFYAESKALSKLLVGCKQCYITAVTLGNGVDLLLRRLEAVSLAEHYITDALASALAEYAADTAEHIITNGVECCPRFSPGYADFCIEKQADILNVLEARKLLGISLSKSLLMTPQKTITAVVGIKK